MSVVRLYEPTAVEASGKRNFGQQRQTAQSRDLSINTAAQRQSPIEKRPNCAAKVAETGKHIHIIECVVGPGGVTQISAISSLRVKHLKIAYWDHYDFSPTVKTADDP